MHSRWPASLRLGIPLALLIGLSLATGAALADKKKKSVVEGNKVDVSKIAKELVIASDGNGNYLVGTPSLGIDELFFGNGKTFYQQIVIGGGGDTSRDQNSYTYFEPRERSYGDIVRVKDVWTVTCGKRKVPFTTVSSAERAKLLKRAKFEPFKFRRQPHALLRDKKGIYYFVDKRRDVGGEVEGLGQDYRLFVGRRGKMKKYKLKDIVDDSEGQIFLTGKGDLHLVIDKTEKITWTKDRKEPKPLKKLPLRANLKLIYTDLGPYETASLGTPCDAL